MADQGCPGEGTDTRWFGVWGCTIQRALSFHSDVEPFSVMLAFPPFIAINVPLFNGTYFSFRAGFRYDRNWKGYIWPEAIIKVKDQALFY